MSREFCKFFSNKLKYFLTGLSDTTILIKILSLSLILCDYEKSSDEWPPSSLTKSRLTPGMSDTQNHKLQ